MNTELATGRAEFVAVAAIDELPVGAPIGVSVLERGICLLRIDQQVLAFEDRCPHRGHPLSAGNCENGVLRCALHGWEFAVPEGRAVSPRAPFGLEMIESRVVDGAVEVKP